MSIKIKDNTIENLEIPANSSNTIEFTKGIESFEEEYSGGLFTAFLRLAGVMSLPMVISLLLIEIKVEHVLLNVLLVVVLIIFAVFWIRLYRSTSNKVPDSVAKRKLENIGYYRLLIKPFLRDDEKVIAISNAYCEKADLFVVSIGNLGYFVFTTHRLILILLTGSKLTFRDESKYIEGGKLKEIINDIIVYDIGQADTLFLKISLFKPSKLRIKLMTQNKERHEVWEIPRRTDNGRKIEKILLKRVAYFESLKSGLLRH